MQSSNPVFRRAEGFGGADARAQRNQTYAGNGITYPGYDTHGDTASGTPGAGGYPGAPVDPYGTGLDQRRMDIDSVVQKTGLTLGVVVLAAALTWVLSGDIVSGNTVDTDVVSRLYLLSMLGAFGGFALSMVNSFKRVVSPPLVLAYAALQGVFMGAFSKVMEAQFGHGIVVGAVVGTIAAVAGTLAAYRFFDIKVGDRFRKFVVAAMFGFVALALLDFVLGFFHASFGFNGFGTVGLISSVVGLGLGVLMLILDFDFVERGIAAGLPDRESWRAAFGLTVTIIWIYIELLRILAIFNSGD